MNYHDITKDDMKNGDGLRVVLWISGCNHHCKNCQNPITWDPDDGLEFDEHALSEIIEQLEKDYISGITLSGGDPLHPRNIIELSRLVRFFKKEFPEKTIWVYTGYKYEELFDNDNWYDYIYREILEKVDVLVDGKYVEELADIKYPWAGSTNQRIIDVQKSLAERKVVLHENYGGTEGNQERRICGEL